MISPWVQLEKSRAREREEGKVMRVSPIISPWVPYTRGLQMCAKQDFSPCLVIRVSLSSQTQSSQVSQGAWISVYPYAGGLLVSASLKSYAILRSLLVYRYIIFILQVNESGPSE